MTGAMFSIECRNLSKEFHSANGSIKPVDGLSLSFKAGEIHAVIGESGCGKTTLLRLIAGLETSDSGTVNFLPEERSPTISIVFQEPRLFPWFTVEKNVALSVRHLDTDAQQEKVSRVLELVGLSRCKHLFPSQLSGGMAQRVGLARALCPEPDILLLDEAFSALDALTRSKIYPEFIRIHERQPVTTVLVTHDVTEAVLLSRNIFRLGHGRLLKTYCVDQPYPRTLSTVGVGSLIEDILNDFLTVTKGDHYEA